MRFSFFGINVVCSLEARLLAVYFWNRFAMVFSAMEKDAWIADSDKYYS